MGEYMSDEINIVDLLNRLGKYKKLIISTTLIVVALVAVYTFQVPTSVSYDAAVTIVPAVNNIAGEQSLSNKKILESLARNSRAKDLQWQFVSSFYDKSSAQKKYEYRNPHIDRPHSPQPLKMADI